MFIHKYEQIIYDSVHYPEHTVHYPKLLLHRKKKPKTSKRKQPHGFLTAPASYYAIA